MKSEAFIFNWVGHCSTRLSFQPSCGEHFARMEIRKAGRKFCGAALHESAAPAFVMLNYEAVRMLSLSREGGWPLNVNCGGARFGPANVLSFEEREGC